MRLLSYLKRVIGIGTPVVLHNTLTGNDEIFTLPSGVKTVRMYNCGPTVYSTQHIGNLSMFVFTDVLRRVLEYNNFTVKQVINITDVGHLSSDADAGEDKMTLGLQREGLDLTMENMRVLADKYTDIFKNDLSALHVDVSRILFPRASDYVPAQIAMIKSLEEKGYAYRGTEAVYFDTSRFPAYGALGSINTKGLQEGARVAPAIDKKHPIDFVLWKLDPHIGWDSPWGKGFPGWHIECSAMIRGTLGTQIDIHTGGIEHIPIHHNNEIAQSECATGKKPLSRFWLHRAHIQINGGKIAKSVGNVVYLSDINEKGFAPGALRLLFLGAHYRTNAAFSWEALEASNTALTRLKALKLSLGDHVGKAPPQWKKLFVARINDDLDTPGALAVMWEMLKDPYVEAADKLAALLDFDRVLNLNLRDVKAIQVPESVAALVNQREDARKSKSWKQADDLREKITALGFVVEDAAEGPVVKKL